MSQRRLAIVGDFVARCRVAGLASIIEPVSRQAHDGLSWDFNDGVLKAAKELGSRGAELYKAGLPLYGKGSETEVRREASELTRVIEGPWVVLSSGVSPDDFPTAVEWACRERASGFLAGWALWKGVIGSPDIETALENDALPNLQKLCDVVDRVVS